MSWHHGWMDGVPLELRPKYYPKPPLRFKDIDIYIPLDAIENDYDFTEERRVLAECKQWEEEKEKERLAEEERQRLQAEENERLRLESERIAIEKLEMEALGDEQANSVDQETSLIADIDNKLILADDLEFSSSSNSKTEELDNSSGIVASNIIPVPILHNSYNSNGGSKQNSHHESPTSEESSISQPPPHPVAALQPQQPLTTTNIEPEPILPGGSGAGATAGSLPPTLHHPPTLNGYQYMMNSDMQMPMYQPHRQTVPHYYPYFISHSPISTAVSSPPVVTMPLQVAPQLPVSSQCPYPPAPSTWNQMNGHCAPAPPQTQMPTATSSSNAVTSSGIAPQQPTQNSHIPSPTQQPTSDQPRQQPPLPQPPPLQSQPQPPPPQSQPQPQPPQQQPQPSNPPTAPESTDTDSFSKVHFPFLSSMAASRGTRERDGGGLGYLSSSFNRSYLSQSNSTPSQHPSTDDIASQNPFLSSFIQSHSPMHHHHQYWPQTSHLPHQQQQTPIQNHQPHQNPSSTHTSTAATPIQNGPVHQSVNIANSNFMANSGPSTAPPTGSQHALL